MRQIKFRAWDKVEKKMTFPFFINDVAHGKGFFLHDFTDIERYEFIQFTGLLDKNGKEIYEGDIVKNTRGNKPVIRQVIWININHRNGWNIAKGSDFEIIGNIYQNPELLGQ